MGKSKEERIALADWAKALSEHPNFNGLINGIVAESLAQLMTSPVGSKQAEAAHISMIGANEFKNALLALVNDGAMAKKEK